MAYQNEQIENVTEREALKLEEKLRKLDVPYSSTEPGPLYWANFRVRVIERVEKRQTAGLFSIAGHWFANHAWQSGIAISAAALLFAAILVHPFSTKSPSSARVAAVTSTPAPSSATPVNTQGSMAVEPGTRVQPAQSHTFATNTERVHREHFRTDGAKPELSREDLAVASEPVMDASDHGVSLDELSQPELEAVLQNLQSNE
ncbi:MAG TPA: hypothetical protein VGM92_13545 [Candidatus Kapabacteria bacterium]|jgi:hypothetical protein